MQAVMKSPSSTGFPLGTPWGMLLLTPLTTMGSKLVPAAKLLMELRAVKDEREIDSLIAAQRIAEKALGEVLDFIRPGVTGRRSSWRPQCIGCR